MSRLSTPSVADATGTAADLFAAIKKNAGKVPNAYATIGGYAPDVLGAALNLDAVLQKSTLSKAEIETIRLATSEVAGCDYCLAAHTVMGKFAGLAPDTMKQIRTGAATGDAKRDALVRFVRAIVTTSGTLPAEELNAVREAGYTERQVMETALAIAAISFTNIVNRVNDTTVDFPAAPSVA
ncbi:carboxymuconolactone decarboxylase family protein [Paraburkholderia phosphatilytica]|uniref:carboxymuconolactone decarboxylase family protein n=1 Tax=Paraburkholderia phosphatilytica TaxID=2282883 RepID=UPI000E47B7EE|nr:carboxymuconolactone decarboxylase family protein [Paraburkholderia phosphatilytica]